MHWSGSEPPHVGSCAGQARMSRAAPPLPFGQVPNGKPPCASDLGAMPEEKSPSAEFREVFKSFWGQLQRPGRCSYDPLRGSRRAAEGHFSRGRILARPEKARRARGKFPPDSASQKEHQPPCRPSLMRRRAGPREPARGIHGTVAKRACQPAWAGLIS